MRFFLLILIVFNSCENSVEVAQYKNFVKLQGQNDHSGIIVKILELNQFSITDSMGYFELPDLADGKYSLEIKYPYFKTHKEEINFEKGHQANYINIELKRLFQFWIEPKDTSISLSDYSNQEPIYLNFFRQYRNNLSDSPIILKRTLAPSNIVSLLPDNNIWPFVTNEDNRHEFCYEMYGWFGSNDLIIDENEIIQPHNISSVEFSLYISNKDCIKEGKYLIYSAPSDQFNYPEYFEAAYFWNDSLPYPQPYNQLNKTLQRKLQLFEPSIIHFTK